MTTKLNCIVCYDENTKYVTCDCKSRMCVDCFKFYMKSCNESKSVLVCPNEVCKDYYPITELSNLDIADRNTYNLIQLTYYLSRNKNGETKAHQENIIAHLRNEKKKFISDNMPKAIILVAKIGLPDKYKKYSTQDVKKQEQEMTKRSCMNNICNGKLNKDLHCIKCFTTFCKKCNDKIMDKQEHICDPNTVQSIISFSSKETRECPGCAIRIFRTDGCDSMTCASCKYTFNFITGEESTHGSHNKPIKNQTQRYYSVRSLYTGTSQKIIDLLIDFDDTKPEEISFNHINILLTRIEQKEKNDLLKDASVFTNKLHKYFKQVKKIKEYNQHAENISKILTDTIEYSKLKLMIDNYK